VDAVAQCTAHAAARAALVGASAKRLRARRATARRLRIPRATSRLFRDPAKPSLARALLFCRVPMTRILLSAVVLAACVSLAVAGAEEPSGEIDVDALVAEAIAQHPDVVEARAIEASLDQVPSRAGSFPDPVFSVSAQNLRTDELAFDAHPMTGLVAGLSLAVPFPGKLGRRERAASARARVATRAIDLVETNVELRVRLAYWDLHYAERAEAIVAENTKIVDMLTDVVHARYGVGQGAQQDALQAQVAHSRLRARLVERREAASSARHALNGAVGREPGAAYGATRAPPPRRPLLPRDALAERAAGANPVLRVSDARIVASERAVEEARYDRLPDLGLAAGYRARWAAAGDASDGADMVSFTVSITLPVWMGDKQSARWREQRHRLSADRAARASVKLEVDTRVERLADAIERIDEQLELYEGEILTEIDQALDASIADYQVGKVNFVSVLDIWRQQLEARLEYERLLASRAQRVAELRALAGGEVEEASE
jgi:outer membrane protein TolC